MPLRFSFAAIGCVRPNASQEDMKEDIRADLRRRTRRTNGDDHVAQTLACCIRCGFAGRGCLGADFGIGLGWTPWRLARWRLAWCLARRLGMARRAPLLCRRSRLLRLWRLLCAPSGAHPLGTSLARNQSLLLRATADRRREETPAGFGRGFPALNQSHDFNSIFTRNFATGCTPPKQSPTPRLGEARCCSTQAARNSL